MSNTTTSSDTIISSNPKKVSFTFNLMGVSVERMEFSKRAQELTNPLAKEDYEFQFDLNMNLVPDDKDVIISLVITLFEKQGKVVKNELAKLETKTTIKVLNFDEVITHSGDRLYYPDQLFPTLIGLSISTARGILLVYTADKVISNALLPIIDPRIFTKDQIVEIVKNRRSKG